jgi:hypothetical protein
MHELYYSEDVFHESGAELVPVSAKYFRRRLDDEVAQTTDAVFQQIIVGFYTDIGYYFGIKALKVIAHSKPLYEVAGQSEDGIGDDLEEKIVLVFHSSSQLVEKQVEDVVSFFDEELVNVSKDVYYYTE